MWIRVPLLQAGRLYLKVPHAGRFSTNCDGPPWKVMFFGSDQFAQKHLEVLHGDVSQSGHMVSRLGVTTTTKKCPIYKYAKENDLPLTLWPSMDDLNQYDLGIVVSFGHLIPQEVITSFRKGMINVHPSLLPRWRGAAPIIHTVLHRDEETGVTIMEIKPKRFDVGPILLQRRLPVRKNITSVELSEELAAVGSDMLLETLGDLTKLMKHSIPQSTEGKSLAHKLKASHASINWEHETELTLYLHYQSVGVLFDLRSSWNGKPVRLHNMVAPKVMKEQGISRGAEVACSNQLTVGTPYYHKHSETLCIRCKDGWAGFRDITIKKPMTAKAFYNGYLSKDHLANIPFISLSSGLEKYLVS